MRQAELPSFEATWWPVTLETVPGSGERITIAAIVRAASGQAQVRQSIPPATLSALFGSSAPGMRMLLAQTVLSVQKQLDAGVPVEHVSLPFGGLAFGTPRDCVGHDMQDVFDVAFRLGGAFSESNHSASEAPSADTRRAFDEWADKVRDELLSDGLAELRMAFNLSLPLQARKKARIGFVRGAYAAQFGVLRPGRSASHDMRALKIKLFDLEALRRTEPLFTRRTELLVGYPEIGEGSAFSARELQSQRDSWTFIELEAQQRNVKAWRYGSARMAAEHLQKAAAA